MYSDFRKNDVLFYLYSSHDFWGGYSLPIARTSIEFNKSVVLDNLANNKDESLKQLLV